MRATILLLPLLACATPSPTPQPLQPTQSAPADRAKLDALLAQENAPPDSWKSLGPDALTLLRQVAGDPAEIPQRRARAVAGMAWLDDGQTTAVLQSFASDGNTLPEIRAAAVIALANHDGAKSVDVIKPILADGSADVRFAAARALGNAGGDAARAALQARLEEEKEPRVRDEIQKSLARMTN